MSKKFIAILFLIPSLCFAYTYDITTRSKLVAKVIEVSGVKLKYPNIKVLYTDNVESYTYADSTPMIVLTKEDADLCNKNDSCVATIIAHEIGHIMHGDVFGNNIPKKEQERRADLYAVDLLKKAGFDPCAGIIFFKNFSAIVGDDGGPDHPNNSTRIDYIQKACQK